MKRILLGMILTVFVINTASCASVQKKFTRKKKEPAHMAAIVYFEEGPYQKKYSNAYYYKMHYTMWKSWQDDLINGIGGNRKKTARNAEESLNHLIEMSHYLMPEKEKELEPILQDLMRLVKKIDLGAYSNSENPDLRVELQKIKRLIDNDFYFDKVSNQILPESVNLGIPAPQAPKADPSPNPGASASPSTT
ncbi:MAG: hypothetical protein AUJ72_02720 [Candidatus Omnitrophica bacterium CG1_02_46_14]|nr:MAG: hypothetical protein AUJ72_02720 [Candidatus Omnitrophica bacterium CG1_02_46_14]